MNERLSVFFRKHIGGSEKSRLLATMTLSDRRLLARSTAAGTTDFLGLLWQKNGLNVRQNTSLSDGYTGQQLVQFLVVADGQLQVTWNDTGFLVVTSGVAGQLENFSRQILHDGGQVDRCTGTDSLGVVSLTKQTVDATNWELESGTARSALRLSLDFAAFSSPRHNDDADDNDFRLYQTKFRTR